MNGLTKSLIILGIALLLFSAVFVLHRNTSGGKRLSSLDIASLKERINNAESVNYSFNGFDGGSFRNEGVSR